MLHQELSNKIIKAFYTVYNTFGYGFLEKVYERAFIIELRKMNLNCSNQIPVKVFYEEQLVGDYYADIIVEDSIIIELKAMEGLCLEHEYQLINYLKATEIEVGLLLNFGEKQEFKRKIFTNDRKEIRNK